MSLIRNDRINGINRMSHNLSSVNGNNTNDNRRNLSINRKLLNLNLSTLKRLTNYEISTRLTKRRRRITNLSAEKVQTSNYKYIVKERSNLTRICLLAVD